MCAVALVASGCNQSKPTHVVTLWHQMRPEDREVLAERIADFERQYVQQDIDVRALYKETEELRSGLESAVLVGHGPDVVYGPSDAVGVYHAIGGLRDMSGWLPEEELGEFDERAVITLPARDDPAEKQLVFLGDRFGNHLALVYNKRFVPEPPATTDELIAAAKDNTRDEDGDGRIDRYGIVWNYTEPFFVIPFLTGHGGWVFEGDTNRPSLNTPEMVAGFEFVARLRHEHNVLPRSADLEAATALFLAEKAAMIIDGDWSWGRYLSAIETAAVAPLPVVNKTNLPMGPMVSPKGYSLTVAAQGENAERAMLLIEFLTNEDTQDKFLEKQKILPARVALRERPLVKNDPTLQASIAQAENGRAMPIVTEMRAVWDAMRGPYQSLMAGEIDAATAANAMQRDAERKIAVMTTRVEPDASVFWLELISLAAVVGLVVWQRHSIAAFFRELPHQPLPYLMVLPALVLMLVTVAFPLIYNVVLSFSNMSLATFRDWEIIGLGNYVTLFTGDGAEKFWFVLSRTVLWTVINVFFHVTLGVVLAVAINGPVRGKGLYRLLLIIPWAVPAYITALTWRGMFDYEFGAVNHAVTAINAWLPQLLRLPLLDWQKTVWPAFAACVIANVWLGFPFMMMVALGGLQGIPQELYEAARVDRASRWQQFRHITLPLLKPVLLPAVTLGAIWTFNNLNVVWLVSNTGEPSDQTHILVSYVYKAVFNLYQYGYGAALSMVIFFILLAFSTLFLQRTKATEAVY